MPGASRGCRRTSRGHWQDCWLNRHLQVPGWIHSSWRGSKCFFISVKFMILMLPNMFLIKFYFSRLSVVDWVEPGLAELQSADLSIAAHQRTLSTAGWSCSMRRLLLAVWPDTSAKPITGWVATPSSPAVWTANGVRTHLHVNVSFQYSTKILSN